MSQKIPSEIFTEIANAVRSGEYYTQARIWHAQTFLAPLSQRNWLLVFAAIAVSCGFFGLVSFASILPIVDRQPVHVSTPNLENVVTESVKLAREGMTANQTILELFITEYVRRREEYSAYRYDKNRAFIKANSDSLTFDAYDKVYRRENPRSPAAILGERGERSIRIISYNLNQSVQPPVASVTFEADIYAKKAFPKTRWTASFSFYYDSLVVEEVTDPETGALSVQTQDPVFKVVQYVVTESK